MSKSISSLAVVAGGEGEVEERLVKKMSESSLELSPRTRGDTSPPPAIPLPDYEGDNPFKKYPVPLLHVCHVSRRQRC